jgi:23S rRNA (guanosine2251-2'-O)-methyltransferase
MAANNHMSPNKTDYQSKKEFFDQLLTIYGRKPVLEALADDTLDIYRLHLADSNKQGGIVKEIVQLAESRQIEIQWHDRKALSYISRSAKQDQGVAADIKVAQHQTIAQFLEKQSPNTASFRLIALDQITNPQNLGMIIRSACAGKIDGILIPSKGCTALSPLVIKASAGTLFKAPIIKCQTLKDALQQLKEAGGCVCALSSHATESLFEHKAEGPIVYILGNESEGVSADIFKLADKKLMIPMSNGVESLNVAVTAALIAFSKSL